VSAYLRKRRKFQASTEDSLSYINTAAKTAWANDVDLDDLGSYIAGTTAYTGDSSLPDTRGSPEDPRLMSLIDSLVRTRVAVEARIVSIATSVRRLPICFVNFTLTTSELTDLCKRMTDPAV
jgi:hypothetical protein